MADKRQLLLKVRRGLKGLRLNIPQQREFGSDAILSFTALVENSSRLTPQERADMLKKLEEQNNVFRSIEVD